MSQLESRRTLTNLDIFGNKGPVFPHSPRPKNERFYNHAVLSSLNVDFIPQLVLPAQEQLAEFLKGELYPVEKIHGPSWENILKREIPAEYVVCSQRAEDLIFHFQVALQALRQVQFLFEQHGFLLIDRNADNIRVALSQESGHFQIGDENWKVYQVDFEVVLDIATLTHQISPSTNLQQRPIISTKMKNHEYVYGQVATTVFTILCELRSAWNHLLPQNIDPDLTQEFFQVTAPNYDFGEDWSDHNSSRRFKRAIASLSNLLKNLNSQL